MDFPETVGQAFTLGARILATIIYPAIIFVRAVSRTWRKIFGGKCTEEVEHTGTKADIQSGTIGVILEAKGWKSGRDGAMPFALTSGQKVVPDADMRFDFPQRLAGEWIVFKFPNSNMTWKFQLPHEPPKGLIVAQCPLWHCSKRKNNSGRA